jgi:hypothetical protein
VHIGKLEPIIPKLEKAFPALVFAFALLLVVPRIAAQTSAIPSELQAAIFAKVFNYDKKIRKPNGAFKVVILVSDKYREHAKSLASGFSKVKVQTTFAKWDELSGKMSAASAVYVFGSENVKAIEKLCYQHKVLSISGDSALVKNGRVAVAIGISNNKPQIMVNLSRAKREGHSFSAQLLKLVKVID